MKTASISSFIFGASLALLASVPTAAQAQTASRPNWVSSYQELSQALQYREARSRGQMQLEVVGQ